MTQLRDLLAKATPRPWHNDELQGIYAGGHPEHTHNIAGIWDGGQTYESCLANAALIVAAINALPLLLDVADAAQALLDAADELADNAYEGMTPHGSLWEAARTALAALKEAK